MLCYLLLGYVVAFSKQDDAVHCISKETLTNILLILSGLDINLASTAAMSIGLQSTNRSFLDTLEHHYQNMSISESFSEWFKNEICDKTLALCRIDKITIATKSAMAIGFICKGLNSNDAQIEEHFLNGLISLQNLKNEEVQLAIGEALALSFAKQSINDDILLETNFTTLRSTKLDIHQLKPFQGSTSYRCKLTFLFR